MVNAPSTTKKSNLIFLGEVHGLPFSPGEIPRDQCQQCLGGGMSTSGDIGAGTVTAMIIGIL